jgi:diacylglycerol O-acyltransferase
VKKLGRRLSSGPRPVWIQETVRPDAHVRRAVLPEGTHLLDWCPDRILVPLDPGRPQWRIDVIDLPDGEFALLFVAHHVLVDGRRGAAVLRSLLDPPGAESGTPPEGPAAAGPGRPHRWRQLRQALGDLSGRAPVTSLSRSVGSGRRLAVVEADMAALRALEAAHGATVNDALLAAVTAGLRELLLGRGEAVAGLSLRASVPVSSGAAGQPEGMLLVSLPVGEPDPFRRLATITASTAALKRRLRAGGGTVFDVLRLPTPLARAAVRGMQHIAGRSINLFVTDVPGPPEPMSLAGAPLLSAVPVAPLTADVPLGIAALSCAGRLSVGINADAGITDLRVLGDAMAREFGILAAAPDRPDGRRSTPTEETSHVTRKKWSELTPAQQTAVLTLASLQLSLAATAWVDLARRPAGQVNGRKGLWAAVIAVNWIGPLSYFRWGRRR